MSRSTWFKNAWNGFQIVGWETVENDPSHPESGKEKHPCPQLEARTSTHQICLDTRFTGDSHVETPSFCWLYLAIVKVSQLSVLKTRCDHDASINSNWAAWHSLCRVSRMAQNQTKAGLNVLDSAPSLSFFFCWRVFHLRILDTQTTMAFMAEAAGRYMQVISGWHLAFYHLQHPGSSTKVCHGPTAWPRHTPKVDMTWTNK